MHTVIRLLFTITSILLSSPGGYAKVIAPCQYLLVDQKERLAQLEFEKFNRLRTRDESPTLYLRGLLIAVYEADLDGEPVEMHEAFTHVPTASETATKYILAAVDQGLLKIGPHPENKRLRVLFPGPGLTTYVRTELGKSVQRIFDEASWVTPPDVDLGQPPEQRSEALDRLILRTMWYDFTRVWQPGAADSHLHLRNTYGLLAHMYKLALSEATMLQRSSRKLLAVSGEGQARAMKALVQHKWLELDPLEEGRAYPSMHLTPRAIDYIEGRINYGIERTNVILRKVAEER